MYSVGHVSLGYIVGKVLGQISGENPSLIAIWTLSLSPDIDFLIINLKHRGPTHSIFFALFLFSPFLILSTRKTMPYFGVFLSHLFGDFITDGGIQLLWPLSTKMWKYQTPLLMDGQLMNYIELSLFIITLLTLFFSKDFFKITNLSWKIILVLIPVIATFMPVMFKYPIRVPKILVLPHIILLFVIFLSFISSMWARYEQYLGIENHK